MSDNNEFSGSRYLAIKAEIAAAERELEEKKKALEAKRAEADKARAEERDQVIYNIRQKIIEYGLYPKELYPGQSSARDLKDLGRMGIVTQPRATVRKPSGHVDERGYRPSRGTLPPKYQWEGFTWSGLGRIPKWFTDAKESGMTEDDLRVRSDNSQH